MNIPYQILATFGPNYLEGNQDKHEIRYYCPVCGDRRGKPDTKGKLYVNTKSLKYHCFLCGYSGQIGKSTKYDINKIYGEDKTQDTEELIHNIKDVLSEDKSIYTLKIPHDSVMSSESAVNYLLSRGFTYDQMEYYDMRVGNLNSEFGRIIIPNQVYKKVYTDFYSARSFIGQSPKYHNPKKEKSSVVFNLHRVPDESPIIIVEGALTAVAAGKHAVATLGKYITAEQASKIAIKHPSKVYVNYDYGAEEYSLRACRILRKVLPSTPIYNVFMKDDRDAADLTHDEYVECLSNAVEYNPLFDSIESIL